jgi:hypothetical protein
MSDPTANNPTSDPTSEPTESPTYVDPYETVWDDDEMKHKHDEFMRMLADAGEEFDTRLESLDNASEEQVAAISDLQSVPDPLTDSLEGGPNPIPIDLDVGAPDAEPGKTTGE